MPALRDPRHEAFARTFPATAYEIPRVGEREALSLNARPLRHRASRGSLLCSTTLPFRCIASTYLSDLDYFANPYSSSKKVLLGELIPNSFDSRLFFHL